LPLVVELVQLSNHQPLHFDGSFVLPAAAKEEEKCQASMKENKSMLNESFTSSGA
jgi:hypothetical protein